jgi:hypothetical protein
MSGRLRLWVPASLLGLFASAAAFADHGCLLKKPCPAPPTKIVVEMSPPEVTFVPAPSASVKAPARSCSPSMHCFPFTVPSQPAAYAPPLAYAPNYAAAPIYAPAPAPTYAPAAMPSFAPAYAPAFAPQAAPCGSAAGFGAFPQGGPASGHGGFGGLGALSGVGAHGTGTAASDLRALADDLEAQERAALDRQLGVMERQYAATRARAAGLTPGNGKQSAPAAGLSPTAGPATNDQVLQELNRLKTIINRMTDLLEAHDEALKKGNLIPPARVP